jgi:long-chain fatty acid transport protein
MTKHGVRPAVLALALTAATAAAHQVQAAGFQLFEESPSAEGNAVAGAAASAEDASTIFFNPAGMTYINQYQTIGGLQIIDPSATFHPHTTTTAPTPISGLAPAPLTGQGNRDLGETTVVPDIYGLAPIGDEWRVGIGITAPYGLITDYGSTTWVGRYYAERSDLKTYDVNPSIAYRATNWLSLGAGIDVLHAHALLKNAIDFGSICANAAGAGTCGLFGLAPQANDGQTSLEANDTTVAWNAGIMLQPLEHTRIGLSYRSRYDLHLDGTATFLVPTAFRALQAAVPAFGGSFMTGSAHAKITLPDTASVAVYHEITPKWALLGDVTWTHWSLFKNLIVTFDNPAQPANVTPENWHDSYRVALGATYMASEDVKLRMGVAYDESPVKSAFRTLRIPDDNRVWISVGYNMVLADGLSLDAAYSHLFYTGNAPVNLTNPNMGTVVGTFSPSVNIFTAGLKYVF